MKLLSKKHQNTEMYKIAFCDTPDLLTKFGEWNGTFDTYSAADHCIRMGWGKAIQAKTANAYQIDGSWLVIEKVAINT